MTAPEYTPREIVAELDRFIIGQGAAKRAVAVALRNRWRRRQLTEELRQSEKAAYERIIRLLSHEVKGIGQGDEGVAFRYVLPKQEGLGEFTLASENTGFYFAADASAYALNMGRFNTHNEGEFLRTRRPADDRFHLPPQSLLF